MLAHYRSPVGSIPDSGTSNVRADRSAIRECALFCCRLDSASGEAENTSRSNISLSKSPAARRTRSIRFRAISFGAAGSKTQSLQYCAVTVVICCLTSALSCRAYARSIACHTSSVNAIVGTSSACAIGSVGRGFGMMTTAFHRSK